VNKSLDHLKKKRPEPVEDIETYRETASGESENLMEFEDSLGSLTLTEKNIVVYKCFFDYTFDMIGKTLEIHQTQQKTITTKQFGNCGWRKVFYEYISKRENK